MKIKWKLSSKRPFKAGDRAVLDISFDKYPFGEPFSSKQSYVIKEVRVQKMSNGVKIPKEKQEQYLIFEKKQHNVGYPAKYFKHED